MKSIPSNNKKRKQPSQARKKKSKKKHKKTTHQEDPKQQSTTSTSTKTSKKENINTTLSLPSRLKRARGTAGTTPLPPKWSREISTSPQFLSPDSSSSTHNDDFSSCHEECYKGFCWDDPEDISQSIHDGFTSSLDAMHESGLFLYDVVQPGGKRSSLTFVTRTLVGDPGSTYKYLGLRLFSHPWCAVDEDGDRKVEKNGSNKSEKMLKVERRNLVQLGYTETCAKSLLQMGQLNQALTNKTKEKLDAEVKPTIQDGLVGSADFSITLVNRMEPTSIKKDLKPDNLHGLGKASVSWHKDSGLQDFSSIAVYHTLQSIEEHHTNNDIPWKVGLRVADPDSNTPALSVPLPSGACYYLLDDFNHQHEHAVISGSDTLRYSSTHRVARDGSGTWQFIRDKSKGVISSNLCTSLLKGDVEVLSSYNTTSLQKKFVKEVRSYHQLMTELEFEWICMWHIQGQHHADLHPYWHQPVKIMKQIFLQLSKVNSFIMNELKTKNKNNSDEKSTFVSEDLFDVLIEAIDNRNKLRVAWKLRLKDKVFRTISKNMRPIPCNMFDDNSDELSSDEVRKLRSAFILKKDGKNKSEKGKNGKGKSNLTSLTKKERKKVASNWQRMKSSIKKK